MFTKETQWTNIHIEKCLMLTNNQIYTDENHKVPFYLYNWWDYGEWNTENLVTGVYISAVTCHLVTGIHSEKCIPDFFLCKHHGVYSHKLRRLQHH
jgi:hypothetical protein